MGNAEEVSLTPAMLGGGLAAAAGGGIWGLIVIATGYVIGIMAWGIGLLAGCAVVFFHVVKKGHHFRLLLSYQAF
jgi:hypothetical protein